MTDLAGADIPRTRGVRALLPPASALRVLGVLCLISPVSPCLAAASASDLPRYEISFDAQMTRADVRLCLERAHAHVAFAPDSPRAMHFFSAVRRSGTGTLDTTGSPWHADHWHAGECLAYAADIAAIADLHSDVGTRFGTSLATDPQHWMVRADTQGPAGAEATVELPEGWSISAPWRELDRAGRSIRFHIPDTPSDWSASVVLGRFEERRIELAGGNLRVALLPGADDAQRAKLTQWLGTVGDALLGVYGRSPLADVQIVVVPVESTSLPFRFFAFLYPSAVLGGESARGQGNELQLIVDPGRPAKEFAGDWTAIHELSHLLHPYLGDRGSWLGEGLATYYQNVLRARAGLLTPAEAWERLAGGFQRSQAGPYADTLENAAEAMGRSHDFLRVYWSGAAYWLTVDSDLRRDSGGTLTLESALSRFRDCCLPAYQEWPPERFVAKLDASLGVQTFSRRYREFARMKRFPDWRALFRQLGVRADKDDVTFDPGAPDAAIRDAITAARASDTTTALK